MTVCRRRTFGNSGIKGFLLIYTKQRCFGSYPPLADLTLPQHQIRFADLGGWRNWQTIKSRDGGIGRRKGLKIPRPQGHEGSTPTSGTKNYEAIFDSETVFEVSEP